MFEGFSSKTIDFMWGIRFNNEKSWFEAHKSEYLNDFFYPMRDLGQEAYDALSGKYPELGLVHKISRIYRDARRLHGRGPYKDRLWFSMERPAEQWTDQPVFWFELAPEGWTYGLGYYCAKALTMAKFRARLDRDPKPFETLVRAFTQQDIFTLDGEEYKRPKDAPSALLAPWYNKKGFSLISENPNEGPLFTPGLKDLLVAGYESLVPFYRYLITLDSDPDPREVN